MNWIKIREKICVWGRKENRKTNKNYNKKEIKEK